VIARERIAGLCDPGSFVELDHRPGDGMIVGSGLVLGRPVAIAAHEPAVRRAGGERLVEKTLAIQGIAARVACPFVGLYDAPGGPVDSRSVFAARRGVGRIYAEHAALAGTVPQVCAVFGKVTSARSFPVAFSDAAVLVEGRAGVSLCPPELAAALIGEPPRPTPASSLADRAGLGDALASSDEDALAWVRRWLSYFPSRRGGPLPIAAPRPPATPGREIEDIAPADERLPFAIGEVIDTIVDAGSLLELKPGHAAEIVTALARIEGHPFGVVANAPAHRGGVLFPETCRKAARFVRLCDAFGLPLLFLVDVPGLMVGRRAEEQGIVAAAAELFAAVARARVPRASVVVRKAYTAGLYAMCGPAFAPDAFLALPTARIDALGPRFAHLLPGEARGLDQLVADGVVDAVVPLSRVRGEVVARLSLGP
jgi:acetyl-CoA carboxylase carboxyltransferase component